jgi:hypothetical protein
LKGDGTVVAWGRNFRGQTNVPPNLTNVVAIGSGASSDQSLAVKADGTVVAWGYPFYVPPDLTNVVAVAAGAAHSLALKSDRTVVAWGGDLYGETDVPVGLTNVIGIGAGYYDSLALDPAGGVVMLDSGDGGALSAPGYFNVILGPPEALAAGAGWRVVETTNTVYFNSNSVTYGLSAATYTLTFHTAQGFLTPANSPLQLVARQTVSVTVNYVNTNLVPGALPTSMSNGVVQLAFSASIGQRYAIERSTNLTEWAALTTNTVGTNGVLRVNDSNLTNDLQRAFYRARFVP